MVAMDEYRELAAFYRDKKILIIGGTGTVGEAMVEMLLKWNPKVIRILSRDEYKQYKLGLKYQNEKRLRYLIGDVRDYERLEKAAHEIDIIFNLAAMKHVPACEYNPFEAVKTNVLGMQNVINASISCKVKNVMFTSSDKAIGPTNAMGATKLLGERLLIAADSMKGNADIVFSAVRFGNVLGSRGSVIPLFKKQIVDEGMVTVTDHNMTRFMMTITDAALLTLKATSISMGGEIFVLKMPNIRITDLIDSVIDMTCDKHGINPETITKHEIGMRPGEKMYEELMTDFECLNSYDLNEMYAIIPVGYKYSKFYEKYPKTKISRYASNQVDVITKEQVKELIIRERLI